VADEAKGPRTETIVRQFDADGALTSETISVVTQVTPEGAEPPGQYL
jgi:hypothetical protein